MTSREGERSFAARVMVTGSREWTAREPIAEAFRALPPSTIVMHGCAKGADTLADIVASTFGLDVETYPPDSSRPSPARFHERNDRMLDRADCVIAFWDGESRGTASVIAKARRRGIPVDVVTVPRGRSPLPGRVPPGGATRSGGGVG